MTIAPENRSPLSLAPHARGKRSPITCLLKCGDACAHAAPNTTDNEYFPDVASRALSRRGVLGAAGAGALAAGRLAGCEQPRRRGDARRRARSRSRPAVQPDRPGAGHRRRRHGSRGLHLGARSSAGATPCSTTRPSSTRPTRPAPARPAQFGYNNDYLDIIPVDGKRRAAAALGVVNHEYTNENIMFPPRRRDAARLEENKRVAMAAHGLTVVELRAQGPRPPLGVRPRGEARNRRITVHDALRRRRSRRRRDPLLKTKDDPVGRTVLGTLNNCAGGTTPWGTVLSGEENFNQYFVAAGPPPRERPLRPPDDRQRHRPQLVRPSTRASTRASPATRTRSTASAGSSRSTRRTPTSTPVKHTALGRFKHEGANVRIARNGHVVAYSGDDERFDYVYKFVSRRKYRKDEGRGARAHNMTLLSEGNLYVAKFTGD